MKKERPPLNSQLRCLECLLLIFAMGAFGISLHAEDNSSLRHCLTDEQPGELEPNAEAEGWVRLQVAAGEIADLAARFPNETDRILGAEFVAELMTTPIKGAKASRNGVQIKSAVITGELDLSNAVIAYDTSFKDCCFRNEVYCRKSRFERSLSLSGSDFRSEVDFTSAEIAGGFLADETQFASPDQEANFEKVKTVGDFVIRNAVFAGKALFTKADVSGDFNAGGAKFTSATEEAIFDSVKVKEYAFFHETVFSGPTSFAYANIGMNFGVEKAQFNDTHSGADLSNMRVGQTAVFSNAVFKGPINLEGLAFQRVATDDWAGFFDMVNRSSYSPGVYTNLESLFRKEGDAKKADAIYIEQKRRERRQFLGGFDWFSSLAQDWLAGYGRHLEWVLPWSAILVVIGALVFWRERGMETQKPADAERFKNRYHPLWYSLDLFLPIIDLGETNVWTPRKDRRAARLYMRFHIILGHLLVPIGLAAWTGIIK